MESGVFLSIHLQFNEHMFYFWEGILVEFSTNNIDFSAIKNKSFIQGTNYRSNNLIL